MQQALCVCGWICVVIPTWLMSLCTCVRSRVKIAYCIVGNHEAAMAVFFIVHPFCANNLENGNSYPKQVPISSRLQDTFLPFVVCQFPLVSFAAETSEHWILCLKLPGLRLSLTQLLVPFV